MLTTVSDCVSPGLIASLIAAPPRPAVDGVAAFAAPGVSQGNEHDRACRAVLLTRIAGLLGVPVLPPGGSSDGMAGRLLLVPGEALLLADAARAGIRERRQLLGGAVPASFVGTKAITHGLFDDDAARPPLWSTRMADDLGDAVLRGFTVFSHADAARAGRALLAMGPVRIKDVCAKAGLGQIVVRDAAALDAMIATQTPAALAEHGLVLEEDLTDVVTYSVGSVELGERMVSYWGSQNLTIDHKGREVYGGSDLFVVPGDLDALARLDLPAELARAVECAARFDRAAHQAYPDLLLTRRNYDVIEGTDAAGRRRIGVLEQSWRVGGASGAEIAAFEAFRDDPSLESVRCSTVEIYDRVTPPVGATLYYAGDDPVAGPMTKYTMRLA
jgi:hypothetical protein